ncbi:type II toxin-antitoxin system HigB family toxin [Niastella koreensis]|uniref:type II toxin-antitoxin system HigB family toxin n=1 Tax=Niastella koreensis TaxID=354356 RepID=UPI00090067D6
MAIFYKGCLLSYFLWLLFNGLCFPFCTGIISFSQFPNAKTLKHNRVRFEIVHNTYRIIAQIDLSNSAWKISATNLPTWPKNTAIRAPSAKY